MVTATPIPWTELDAERRATLAVDGVEPRLYARPTSPEELGQVLRQATEDGLAVAPRGGGTRLGLGNPPTRVDLVVETTGLDRVVEYQPADLTVTVQAGMRLSALQELLREEGQFLALDPPAEPASTIGGVIATNASGPLRFQYGTARDLVIGTRVANADGRLTKAGGRVVKNVAGYDLNKLYVGSLGTLGVIVELSFKLHPIPPAQGLVVGRFAAGSAARAMLAAVLHSPLAPLGVELLGPAGAAAVGLPRSLAVALRVGGYPGAVERQVRDLGGLIAQHGGTPVEVPDQTWEAVRALALDDRAQVLLKAAVPIAQSTAALEILEHDLAAFDPLAWSHAGSGIVCAACDAPAEPAGLVAALLRCRTRVMALGGNASLVVERAPATLKGGLDVWGDPGPSLRLMRALKQQFDPRGTLNPGRYVGGI